MLKLYDINIPIKIFKMIYKSKNNNTVVLLNSDSDWHEAFQSFFVIILIYFCAGQTWIWVSWNTQKVCMRLVLNNTKIVHIQEISIMPDTIWSLLHYSITKLN